MNLDSFQRSNDKYYNNMIVDNGNQSLACGRKANSEVSNSNWAQRQKSDYLAHNFSDSDKPKFVRETIITKVENRLKISISKTTIDYQHNKKHNLLHLLLETDPSISIIMILLFWTMFIKEYNITSILPIKDPTIASNILLMVHKH